MPNKRIKNEVIAKWSRRKEIKQSAVYEATEPPVDRIAVLEMTMGHPKSSRTAEKYTKARKRAIDDATVSEA